MSESKYKVTIGLEVHAELKTASKMFCDCVNNPDEENPNTNICPVCMAHPGTLPVLNKKAVENVIKVGLAIDGNIANFTEWDRKNYFYPDIPKGYQISQYKYPIVSGGKLAGVDITRIHLEEDTANNKHTAEASLIDFNRAGVPLMELVTEPVIHSAEDAGKFGRELQLLLRTLGVSDANMEKGEMRVELNLSVSDTDVFGTKVEVKNINSFRAVEKAARFEIDRHIKLLEEGRGDEIVQETRGWDENKEVTFSQRKKENSEDYRYFPEPDLPKVYLHELFDLEKMRDELPELPSAKRERYLALGIKSEDVEVFLRKHNLEVFLEESIKELGNDKDSIKKLVNYICSDLLGLITREIEDHKNGEGQFSASQYAHLAFLTREPVFDEMPSEEMESNLTPVNFAKLIKLNIENKINSRATKDLIVDLIRVGGNPEEIAKEKGLLQESNTDAIKEIVQSVINANEKVVADYKAGNENSLKFLMGQVMRESKGSANPQIAQQILTDLLK